MNWQDWCRLNGRPSITGSSHTHTYTQPKRRDAPGTGSNGHSRAAHPRNACRDHGRTEVFADDSRKCCAAAHEVEKRMARYTSQLESRIEQLPKSLQEGLDTARIAKLLGESLRQCFQQSGLPDTAVALAQSCSEMKAVQKQLVYLLHEVGHPEDGVIVKIRSANESLLRSMATRAQQIDGLLGRLEKQVWATWLPVVACAALALGFALGTWFANERQVTRETPSAPQSQPGLLAPDVAPPGRCFKEGVSYIL
jgi:hypothetical protein